MNLSLYHWYPGSGVVLDCIDSDLCTLTYFDEKLSLGCLLMRTIASFQRYTGYLNFINGPISQVLLLILVHVQLLTCLFF